MQEIILLEDIDAVGRRGSLLRVKNGFALNHLIPKGLAVVATVDNMNRLAGLRKKFEADEKVRIAHAKDLSNRLGTVSLTIPMKASDEGHLYGSVSVATLVEKLAAAGHTIEPRAIKLMEPIKEVGVYNVPVVLHDSVKTELKVWVVEEKAASAEVPAEVSVAAVEADAEES